ncbi:L-glyceraldehyde 3-phosphate reductase [Planctomycetes bacterium MalM25]|nr:L-glyceraldehyde 3-phosphate reductase [Planctomycetes bacterium MalM25]
MQRRRLGQSSLAVSELCLGTMTFGTHTDEAEAFRILDTAYERGVNFFDAAEMYPVPPSAETFGVTEEIFGRWLKTKPRDSVIVGTKVTGPGHGWFVPPVRHGMTSLDEHTIRRAVEGSLNRLQTDYLDLYQTHWPDHGYPYEELLSTLDSLVIEGKVRALGASNETCWGLMKSLQAAETRGLGRYNTVQNNFSLINRRCESELAQVCRRESVSLLPYSPLGGGVLTGKYNDRLPAGARFTDYLNNGGERQQMMAKRFVNERTLETARRLGAIAADLSVSLTTLAVAWSKQHDFVASTIFGVRSLEQLEANLAAADLVLDEETLARIDQLDVEIPNPMTEDGLRRL